MSIFTGFNPMSQEVRIVVNNQESWQNRDPIESGFKRKTKEKLAPERVPKPVTFGDNGCGVYRHIATGKAYPTPNHPQWQNLPESTRTKVLELLHMATA